MAIGGFRNPFQFRFIAFGAGTITPVNPPRALPKYVALPGSQLNIRGENNRLRGKTANKDAYVATLQENLPKMFEALQTHGNLVENLIRKVQAAFPFIAQDPSGNVVMTGATFVVRAGSQTFTLANGRMSFGAANTAPNDGDIPASHVAIWVDEGTDELTFRVRYSDGTLKTGVVALV